MSAHDRNHAVALLHKALARLSAVDRAISSIRSEDPIEPVEET
jgi:hypothetical protein